MADGIKGKNHKKIWVLNGPNLNLLGIRDPLKYGVKTYEDVVRELKSEGEQHLAEVYFFQSNHEGALIDKIHDIILGEEVHGIIINGGGLTHPSISLGDALESVPCPIIEVHISDIYSREPYRHHSYIKPHTIKQYVGHGTDGYLLALRHLLLKA